MPPVHPRVRNRHIVIVRTAGYSGSAWMCEDCGQRGMSLSGGPHRLQMKYARGKHVCREDKRRGWCNR